MDLLFELSTDSLLTPEENSHYHFIAETTPLTFSSAFNFCSGAGFPMLEIQNDEDLQFYRQQFPQINIVWIDTNYIGKASKLFYRSGKIVPPLLKNELTTSMDLSAAKPCATINLSTGKISQSSCNKKVPVICAKQTSQVTSRSLVSKLTLTVKNLLQNFVLLDQKRPAFPRNEKCTSTQSFIEFFYLDYPFKTFEHSLEMDTSTLYSSLIIFKEQLQNLILAMKEPDTFLPTFLNLHASFNGSMSIFQNEDIICVCPKDGNVLEPSATAPEDNTTTDPADITTTDHGIDEDNKGKEIGEDKDGLSSTDILNLTCTIIICIVSLMTGVQLITYWRKKHRRPRSTHQRRQDVRVHQVRLHDLSTLSEPIVSFS